MPSARARCPSSCLAGFTPPKFALTPAHVRRGPILCGRKVAPSAMLETAMNENMLVVASRLSDDALVSKLRSLAQGSRQTTVELLAHLGELAARKLYRREGPGRLFSYCTQVLRFSEAAAWNRIKAAKAARNFPLVLDLLADGSVNLTTIRLLSPHLTPQNHRALLAEATGMTRREVDKVVARLNPKPRRRCGRDRRASVGPVAQGDGAQGICRNVPPARRPTLEAGIPSHPRGRRARGVGT